MLKPSQVWSLTQSPSVDFFTTHGVLNYARRPWQRLSISVVRRDEVRSRSVKILELARSRRFGWDQ